MGKGENLDELVLRLEHDDPSVRFWAAMGFAIAGDQARDYEDLLLERAGDPTGVVRVAIAEALFGLNQNARAMEITEEALNHSDGHVNLRALNLIEALDPEPLTQNIKNRIRYFAEEYENQEAAAAGYVLRASERLVEKLEL